VKFVSDSNSKLDRRLRLMEALGETDSSVAVEILSDIATRLESPAVTKSALLALQRSVDGNLARGIASHLPKYDSESQIAALNILASRAETTAPLLDLFSAKQLNPKIVPADVVSKIRLHHPDVAAKIWGPEKRQTTGELQVEIDRLTSLLSTGSGNPYEGLKTYNLACATCHKFFNKGGEIGPDLTAYKRDDLQTMLLNIVHPNAEIREGYVNYLVTTKDARALSGFLADEDKQVVILRGTDGANQTIPRAEIQEMKPTGLSLMPEGLLQSLEDQQIRDLFAYLRSAQPLVR
jgi:putative heme-binding domain-containing protein